MNSLSPSFTSEPGSLVITIVALVAGLIRGFTGFGGPAFMLATLTIFFNPVSVLAKVLVVDFFANFYLFHSRYKKTHWPTALWMVIPTLIMAPLGHWLLIEIDAELAKQIIAIIIATSCILMLVGIRFKHPLGKVGLLSVGIISGLVFGGTYIALVAVVAILLGPYDKEHGRTLIITWSFFAVLGFALVSIYYGTTGLSDVKAALPGAVSYMIGTWLGSLGFKQSSEKLFRRIAISVLLGLALFNLVL